MALHCGKQPSPRLSMADPRIAPEAHERSHPRLRLDIPARLETLHGAFTVRLIDISQGGAHVELPHVLELGHAVLQWLEFEAFGDIVWQDNAAIGLRFDKPLVPKVLFRTRQAAPSLLAAADRAVSAAAQEWVSGSFSVGTER